MGCIENVVENLKKNRMNGEAKEISIGIDSAIDKIAKAVHSKSQDNQKVFFSDIAQFGNHIVSKSGMSCGIEITETLTKLGGNAPIMSNALGTLGIKVNCISPLGMPEIHPVFKNLSKNCKLYSIGNPAYTTAIEFDDGKILLAQVEYLDMVNWITMKETLGLENIKNFFNKSNLIGLVNWSCMINFNNILEGILEEILLEHTVNKAQTVFFDLADFSKRERVDVCEATKLINKFNQHYRVVLGLNENETRLLYKNLFNENAPSSLLEIGNRIYEELEVDGLVVHTLTSSIAWDRSRVIEAPSLFIKEPKLSTGGGDNFNAGLCYGLLLGLELEGALYTANATSGYYVRNAKSPTFDNLIDTLQNWDELLEIHK